MKSTSKKLFISIPMHGVDEVDILDTRDLIYKSMCKVGDYELLDTYHRDNVPEGAGRLWYLGRSIQDLGQADLVIFAPGWNLAKGCVVEHMACEVYKIPYINWAETTEGVIRMMSDRDDDDRK